MRRVLVTGGAGFIGSNYVRYLGKRKSDLVLVVLDALTYAGNLENLVGIDDIEFIKGDICDQDLIGKIFKKYEFDTIVHFAAESHVDRSIAGPAPFIQTNIFGTFVLLEAAKKLWNDEFEGKRFHHISTDEVFGTLAPDAKAFEETTPYDPRSPYSASKASSDHLVRAYYHTYGLPISISNCSNNYGPHQFPEKLIPVVITSCMQGRPIPIYGDGMQIRDWLFVTDHCRAIQTVIEKGIVGETYNVGGENQIPNLELVERICAIMDQKMPASPYYPHEDLISFVTDRPGHDRRYDIDITKIKTELGWSPREDIASGLEHTIDWYIHNMKWVEQSIVRTRIG